MKGEEYLFYLVLEKDITINGVGFGEVYFKII